MNFSIENELKLIEFLEDAFEEVNTDYLVYSSDGEDCSEDWVQDRLDCICELVGANWVERGCSKSVFYFEEFPNIVVKIPFKKVAVCEEEKDEQGEWYTYLDSSYELCGHNLGSNYCEAESIVYSMAKTKGIAKFFAETRYLFSQDGLEFYISEYIPHEVYYSDYNMHDDSYNKSKKIIGSRNFNKIDIEFCAAMLRQTNVEDFEKLIDFIIEMDIDDFHSGNFKKDNNGNLVIIDYSGFND